MICRMCLADCTEFINIFDTEGQELSIASIITKHFWFEPKSDDPISIMVCNVCWWKIESFHIYFKSIEEAHRKLSERFSVKNEKKELPFGYLEDDTKRICVKKEDNLAVEVNVLVEGEPFFEVAEENEDVEDLLEAQSDEPKYVEIIPHDDEDEFDPIEPDEMTCTEKLEVEKSEENIIETASSECQEKEDSPGRCTRQTKETMDNETDTPAIENDDSTPIKVYQKRRPRGRPKKVDKNVEKDETSGPESKKQKTEKESEYIRKSKEDDDRIAKYMKLKCEFCTAECRTFADVKKHYRMVHKRKGYVVCCNKKLYKRILILDHINKHLNPDYFKCEICNKRFSDKQCLKNHMVRHESEEAKIYKCEQCPRRYAKQYLLDNHKLIHVPPEQREFFCNECGKAFPTNNLLQTHIRYVHENVYGKMCHICAKVIRGKTMFEKHQLEHAGIVQPKVQCKQCGAWLKHEYSLKKHMVRHAEERHAHVCNVCGKVAPSKGALRSHIQYVHASERSHQCSICDKAFKKQLNLKEHMTTHTGEVLYTCPHCPKTFNSSANMHSHRKKFHRKEWEENRRSKGFPLGDYKNNDHDEAEEQEVFEIEEVDG